MVARGQAAAICSSAVSKSKPHRANGQYQTIASCSR